MRSSCSSISDRSSTSVVRSMSPRLPSSTISFSETSESGSIKLSRRRASFLGSTSIGTILSPVLNFISSSAPVFPGSPTARYSFCPRLNKGRTWYFSMTFSDTSCKGAVSVLMPSISIIGMPNSSEARQVAATTWTLFCSMDWR